MNLSQKNKWSTMRAAASELSPNDFEIWIEIKKVTRNERCQYGEWNVTECGVVLVR